MMQERNSLREAIEVISSLVSLSHSIRVFTGKWQAIRNRLNELNSTLTAAENCHSEESSELSGVILAMIETLQECHGHARRCLDLSYIGKLLMQSDLDVVLAKVDKHTQNLSGVVTSGILMRGQAIVVSKPVVGACVDDMKFYVRDLLTRLKIGDKEMKKQALVAINEVVVEDDKYVKIIVEVSEIIHALVTCLESDDSQMQEECTKVVDVISGCERSKNVLIGAGIIAPLIRVLESGNQGGKEGSAKCLKKLTANSDNAWSVSAHGGVTALLKICTINEEGGGELVGLACGVLKNVAGVEEIKRYIVGEGAIPTFIKLVRSNDEGSRVNSMELLQTLAFRDESVRQLVIEEGGINALDSVFCAKSCSSSSSLRSREVALGTISSIFLTSISSINMLMNHGFLDQLLHFLHDGEVSIQELALKSVLQLCEASEAAKKSMGDAGFMSELVTFLNAKSFEVRELAAEALYYMILVPRNRRRFIQEDANISFLMQSLDPEGGYSGNKKFLLCTLMEITSSNSGRKKIVSSGYLRNIELAEAEISYAKRIVRNLSTNRFRGMLNRILHT